MTTISPSAEAKLYRFVAEPRARWVDDQAQRMHRRYQSIFTDETLSIEPPKLPVHDPVPATHTGW